MYTVRPIDTQTTVTHGCKFVQLHHLFGCLELIQRSLFPRSLQIPNFALTLCKFPFPIQLTRNTSRHPIIEPSLHTHNPAQVICYTHTHTHTHTVTRSQLPTSILRFQNPAALRHVHSALLRADKFAKFLQNRTAPPASSCLHTFLQFRL